jgi:hypothetical protein
LEAKSDKGMELGQKEEKYREEKVHKGLKGWRSEYTPLNTTK